jgi:Tol biopolymer transport system component
LYSLPRFLPDGEHFVFVASVGDVIRAGATRQLWGGRLGSTERTLLIDGNQFGMPVTADDTHLLLMRGQSLVAQPYTVNPFALTGNATPIVDQVKLMADRPYAFVAASATGLLGYVPEVSTAIHQLRWFDRDGHQLATLGEPANYTNIELSADDARAALAVLDPIKRTRDIWLFDLARSVRTRFTFNPGEERSAVWSPDGTRVVFNSQRKGTERELFARAANGSGAEEIILADGKSKDALSWSSDGRFVLYRTSGTAGNEIWALPMDGARKPIPVVTTGNALQGRFSPDGRWVAHVGTESGRTEVFVVAFPGPGGKWQISNAGGSFPRWRADGRELFYLGADGSIVAVPIDVAAGTLSPGRAQSLFHADVPRDAGYQYDVSRDGQRFLVNTTTGPASTMSVFTDWRRLVE